MLEIERARALRLPGGAYLKVETDGEDVRATETDPKSWQSLDITLVRPDGREEILCSLDQEEGKGLRVLVFDREHEEPVYEKTVLGTQDSAK